MTASRARLPDEEGFVTRDGVRVSWERYGDNGPTLFFLPVWPIAPSHVLWKAQLPYLARHFRVLTCDPRGHGRSDRPREAHAYAEDEVLSDFIAVMDATRTDRAVLVGLSLGCRFAVRLAGEHPDRVAGVVALSSPLGMSRWDPRSLFWRLPLAGFHSRPISRRGLLRFNAHEIRLDLVDWAEWAARIWFVEPHSTRQIELTREWAAEADPDAVVMSLAAPRKRSRRHHLRLARAVRCPVLVMHGSADRWTPPVDGRLLARATGGRLIMVEGAGHSLPGRQPVAVNIAIRNFVTEVNA